MAGSNQEGCQTVAGGRSYAETSGSVPKLDRTQEGCQNH
jgi:hypothetical protein